jgi:hypothetical protein
MKILVVQMPFTVLKMHNLRPFVVNNNKKSVDVLYIIIFGLG